MQIARLTGHGDGRLICSPQQANIHLCIQYNDPMKIIFLSILCMIGGFVGQSFTRPAVEQLEYEASVAWNETKLAEAEQLARQALGRSENSTRAKEILSKLAGPLQRPEIELALVIGNQNPSEFTERQFTEAGRIAMYGNLFRIADELFSQGITKYPRSQVLQRQYASLPGLQLNAEEMQIRLIQWSKQGALPKDLVVMFLGLASLDSRGASSAENWLKASLSADATDLESRLGLGRCFLAMGRYQECIQLLENHCHDPRAAVMQAVAHATERDLAAAEKLLPANEPTVMKAEFWHATGLICVEQEKWDDAEHAFQKAVLARPLNKLFRSRYCEILRRLKKNEEEMIQAEKLEKVIRIVQASINPLSVSDRASLLSIAQMCIEVDAADVAPLVTAVAGK